MTTKRGTTALLWFRNDLRLADHPALAAALAGADRILPVFVLDDEAAGDARLGGASRWWLHYSLKALAEDLHCKGATLILRRGDARKIIPALAKEIGAQGVYVTRAHEPGPRAVDQAVAKTLEAASIEFKPYLAASLFLPESIKTKSGGTYNVYTPFANACAKLEIAHELLPAPQKIPVIAKVTSDRLEDWRLLPTKPDWAGGLRESWQPGEAGARERLDQFTADAIDDYQRARDYPAETGTSGLSPHLHFGEISIFAVWQAAAQSGTGQGVKTFLKELLWREFSIYLLFHYPDLATQPMRTQFKKFSWAKGKTGLKAWQRGRTGIPIVDAGMRQLWQTGWMHNRVRMITASFLIKHLLLPWQLGEAWFWDTLAEADLAANAASWQWVAGCGADGAPYFRIFNPVLQSKKFDAEGEYLRRFVPELGKLPNKFIHAPWEAPAEVLKNAGVTLGKTYPRPVISLSEGRNRALAAFKKIRNN